MLLTCLCFVIFFCAEKVFKRQVRYARNECPEYFIEMSMMTVRDSDNLYKFLIKFKSTRRIILNFLTNGKLQIEMIYDNQKASIKFIQCLRMNRDPVKLYKKM